MSTFHISTILHMSTNNMSTFHVHIMFRVMELILRIKILVSQYRETLLVGTMTFILGSNI